MQVNTLTKNLKTNDDLSFPHLSSYRNRYRLLVSLWQIGPDPMSSKSVHRAPQVWIFSPGITRTLAVQAPFKHGRLLLDRHCNDTRIAAGESYR